ncbi:MAG: DNA mismatch repair endonuclease MutL [Planctomycetaceae bacterium]|nr:DNA mismatch repair endonuclease MutL [Planctomycetaceae bacterium]
MAKIAVLDDAMINMIAAGEVIERPGSVVKELLENSIDAGASSVAVEVEEGGRDLIRVIDDGAGMDSGDLALAFEPHATSKIRTDADLAAIHTMGFRGEALASIAAVARVSATSRTADSISGCRVEIDCGRTVAVRPCAAAVGTTIEVRNLFYKLPARRKFLRSANTEMSHISEHFTRIALAQDGLELALSHNGRQTCHLLSGQGIRERVAVLFGEGLAEDLIETSRAERGIQIRAFLAKPAAARAGSSYQYVFLNGRFIRDKFILHAVKEAYRGLMEPNRFPVVFLFVRIPPEDFDINVHPTKVEVRFDNANLVHSEVLSALRDKLLSANLDVGGSFPADRDIAFDSLRPADSPQEAARKQRVQQAMEDFFDKPAPSRRQNAFEFQPSDSNTRAMPRPRPQIEDFPSFETPAVQSAGAVKNFLQVHNSYILMQSEDGFVVIDQHALHERILYEQMCRRLREGSLPSQRLLMPHAFEVTRAQLGVFESRRQLFENLGMELDLFGPGTLALRAFPALLDQVDPVEFTREMLDKLADEAAETDAERLLHELLDMAACKAAIKAGQPLSDDEIAQLLKDKDIVQRTSRCPHGRPTTIAFSLKELEKQFKRTGF